MIDSMLDDDSPVSCDPAHSRDVYQVAIDELTNGGQTGSFNRDDIAAAARAVSGSQAAPAGSTAAFVALVANAAANNAYNATSGDANASADYSYVDEAITADEEAVAARRAAESSLWGAPAQQQRLRLRRTTQTSPACLSSPVPRTSILTTSMNLQPSPHRLMPKIASTPATFRTPRSRSMSPWPITRATRTCGPPPPRFWMRLTSPLLLQSPLPSLPLSLLLPPMSPSQRCVPRGYRPYLAREHRAGRGYCRRHYGKSSSRARQSDPRGRDRAPAVLYRQAYGPCLSERYRGRYRQLRAAPRGGITSAWLR